MNIPKLNSYDATFGSKGQIRSQVIKSAQATMDKCEASVEPMAKDILEGKKITLAMRANIIGLYFKFRVSDIAKKVASIKIPQ